MRAHFLSGIPGGFLIEELLEVNEMQRSVSVEWLPVSTWRGEASETTLDLPLPSFPGTAPKILFQLPY